MVGKHSTIWAPQTDLSYLIQRNSLKVNTRDFLMHHFSASWIPNNSKYYLTFPYCKGGNFNIHIWVWFGNFIC